LKRIGERGGIKGEGQVGKIERSKEGDKKRAEEAMVGKEGAQF